MKLLNFDLAENTNTVELKGLGYSWDLQNYAYFSRMEYDAVEDYAILEFGADDEDNPWSDPRNQAFGCQIVFRNVSRFLVNQREKNLLTDEDIYLSGISKCSPRGEKISPGEDFDLLFEFQNGQIVQIGADLAELCAIEQEHPFSRN